MPSVERDITLPFDHTLVSGVLTDLEQYSQWHPTHDSWPDSPGGAPVLALGEAFVQRTRFVGRSADVRWTVTELDAPPRITLRGDAGLGLTMDSAYRLAPVPAAAPTCA